MNAKHFLGAVGLPNQLCRFVSTCLGSDVLVAVLPVECVSVHRLLDLRLDQAKDQAKTFLIAANCC